MSLPTMPDSEHTSMRPPIMRSTAFLKTTFPSICGQSMNGSTTPLPSSLTGMNGRLRMSKTRSASVSA
jgi:hypothetical protein